MYFRYEQSLTPGGTRFIRLPDELHLFGCKAGEIPRLLRLQVPPTQSEPYQWHLRVEEILAPQRQALIIDLKPKNKNPQASRSLYQIRDVWGYSSPKWTPGMMRLRGILVDGQPAITDPKDFVVQPESQHDSIYTFTQFDGTVNGGKLVGKWTAPRQSSTNSVLLWPEALDYFIAEIQRTTPELNAMSAVRSPEAIALPSVPKIEY